MRTTIHLGIATVLLIVAMWISAATGAYPIHLHDLTSLDWDNQALVVFTQLRLPRIILGALVGAALAAAGTTYQGCLNNPLADPYLLGISSGAGLAVTILAALGGAGALGAATPAAFIGALIAVGLTLIVSRGIGHNTNPATIILAGVATGSLFGAAQTYLQQANADTLKSVYSWMLGHLLTSGWNNIALAAAPILISIAIMSGGGKLLNLLAVGDEEATSLGVNPAHIRAALLAAATLATATAVAHSGLIGFVGIIIPHAIRRAITTDYRLLIPLSAIYGATFLVATDVLARTLLSPAELPIGVITAFIGAPFFMLLLARKNT
ncbi:FecCD family ABC transporter permease [Corynebacterium aquilae]|uniref:Iron ABC transporter permease n=1 Tax=Corynebacterium aquilae DSM 44791 TaxID=1431546 RepID=A0A1L7CDS3_9CORY|nr:iron ABC transporter permease [Corynebacterium aquilae]APT83987.1 hypothetical protein CAQU_01645 [Corynebacterium aquilae DSM 44791]